MSGSLKKTGYDATATAIRIPSFYSVQCYPSSYQGHTKAYDIERPCDDTKCNHTDAHYRHCTCQYAAEAKLLSFSLILCGFQSLSVLCFPISNTRLGCFAQLVDFFHIFYVKVAHYHNSVGFADILL